MQILHVQDRKAHGTPGQSFSGGNFETCHLGTVLKNTIPGAVWAGHEGCLPPGDYMAWAKSTGPGGAQRLAICDTTSGAALPDAVLVDGVNGSASGPAASRNVSCEGPFTIIPGQKIKLMLNGPGGNCPVGGLAPAIPGTGLTDDEVYSNLVIVPL